MSIVQTKEIVVDKVSPPQDYVGHNKGERESAFKMQKMYLCQYLYILHNSYICLFGCLCLVVKHQKTNIYTQGTRLLARRETT